MGYLYTKRVVILMAHGVSKNENANPPVCMQKPPTSSSALAHCCFESDTNPPPPQDWDRQTGEPHCTCNTFVLLAFCLIIASTQ